MTREEAIEFIAQSVKSDVDMAKVADAIKALEQEPILDRVRAELESKLDNINRLYNQDNQYDDGAIDSLQYALDIIDKYKAETENP